MGNDTSAEESPATPLFNAAFRGSLPDFNKALAELQKKMPKQTTEDIILKARDTCDNSKYKGCSILHVVCRPNLPELVDRDNLAGAKLDMLKNLLSRKIFDVNEKNPVTGRTALHEACDIPTSRVGVWRSHTADSALGIVTALLEEGAICSDDEKLIIDNEGFDPLTLAARSGFTRCVQELVGRGARVGPVDLKFKKNALHYVFECSEHINTVSILEVLLPGANQDSRTAVGFTNAGWPVTPFLNCLIGSVNNSSDGGISNVEYFLKNGINFFEEIAGYLLHVSTHVPTSGALGDDGSYSDEQQTYNGPKDLGRTVLTAMKKKLIHPTLHDLFLADSPYTRDAHAYPWNPSFYFGELDWNSEKYEESPLFQLGKASPLVGALILMRFDLFKMILSQVGFGMMLKPIESSVFPSSTSTLQLSNRTGEKVLRVVPMYILAAAYIPLETANSFMKAAFDLADADDLKEFSAFKSYAAEDMDELVQTGNADINSVLVQDTKTAKKYCMYDYFPHRETFVSYAFNAPETEKNVETLLAKNSCMISDEKTFLMMYHSANHIQQRVQWVSFFNNESSLTSADDDTLLPRFLSKFKHLKRVATLSSKHQTLKDFESIANYEQEEEGRALEEISISYPSDENGEHLTKEHFEILLKSEKLQKSLKVLQLPSLGILYDEDDDENCLLDRIIGTFTNVTEIILMKFSNNNKSHGAIVESLKEKYSDGDRKLNLECR